jgi:hypothetical protein
MAWPTIAKNKNEKGNHMVQIHPDRLTGDVIVESRSADRNHLVQLSHEQYQAACEVAERLSSSINDFFLWVHIPDSGIDMAGQGVASMEEMALNVGFVDGSESAKKALERQASFRNQSVEEYIGSLVLKELAQDEANSVFHPKSGAVLARRSDFGSVLKRTRLSQPNGDRALGV